ncbi:hypothetical protein Ancab_035787 [Ancistrocladus abbreviatus]
MKHTLYNFPRTQHIKDQGTADLSLTGSGVGPLAKSLVVVEIGRRGHRRRRRRRRRRGHPPYSDWSGRVAVVVDRGAGCLAGGPLESGEWRLETWRVETRRAQWLRCCSAAAASRRRWERNQKWNLRVREVGLETGEMN